MKINFTQSFEFKNNQNTALVLLITEEIAKKSSEGFLKKLKNFMVLKENLVKLICWLQILVY